MTFAELLENLKKLEFQETRTDDHDRLEFVLATSLLEKLNGTLGSFFGPAIKMAGKNPSGEQNEMAKEFGGIMKNQTLYSAQENHASFVAMIWPWSNGELATVKIFQISIK